MERTLETVLQELESLRKERDEIKAQAAEEAVRREAIEVQQQAVLEQLETIETTGTESKTDGASWRPGGYRFAADRGFLGKLRNASSLPAGLRLGGYGEHHFNFVEGTGKDISDIHRFVAYAGYEFADWIQFNSETEIEHAFVSEGDGEISLEQFYLDLNIAKPINLRIGRMLHPAGLINRYHEPTTFLGVERPTFSKIILPSTWSIDGIGLFGSITDWMTYEVYAHAGLDGSKFSAGDGIRGGRMNERPSLNDIGVSGRIDVYPLAAAEVTSSLDSRFGLSYSYVGTENGNRGNNSRSPDGSVQIFSADTDLRLGDWEARSEIAFLTNTAANDPAVGPGAADELFGAHIQLGYHFWPTQWKTGKLAKSDAISFVRYGYLDPQFGDVPGGNRDRSKSLRETTLGLSFYPVPNVVLKTDYTIVDTLDGEASNRFDVGFGYDF